MSDLAVTPYAVGACIVCGSDSAGSSYWVGMSQEVWDIIRSSCDHLFQVSKWSGKMEAKTFFVVGLDKPLCGPECSLKHGRN